MKNDILLLEMSYGKLLYNTRKNFDSGRAQRSSNVVLTNTIFIPYVQSDELEVRAESRSTNDKYSSRIIFSNVVFRNEPSDQTATVVGTDGAEYHFTKIGRNRVDVKVGCSCLDFHFRFAAFNHRDGALAGDPPDPYVKRTDRKPVNPAKVSGVCKHIIRLAEELEKEKIFL